MSLKLDESLIVFALEMESRSLFDRHRLIHTGVGKIHAAYHLSKAICQKRPALVVNLGSAGSSVHKTGSVVCCTGFIQRDMDVTPLGVEKYATPFSSHPTLLSNGIKLENMPHAICGTGDNFETSHHQDTPPYDVVDMEAYALAHICEEENIPFLCLKYISDGADGAAAGQWEDALHDGAHKLHDMLISFENNAVNGYIIHQDQ